MEETQSFELNETLARLLEHEQFIPIPLNILQEHQEYAFPIYVLDLENQKFLLYCEAETPFGFGHIQILTQGGKHPLFVPTEFSAILNRMLTENLSSSMEDPSLPEDQKAERFHTLSVSIMKSLFDSPPDIKTFIKTAEVVSDHMAQLIMSGPRAIGKLQELRSFDYYTFSHSLNVTALTIGLYLDMNPATDQERVSELTRGVLLHDIGKCDIPKEILNKRGPLDDEQWEIMKSHTVLGYEKLKADQRLAEDSRLVALCHHEAWDGSGYPYGKKKNEIPFSSRVCKVCDVYDALTSKRSYKDKNSPFDSLKLMKEEMRNHFDYEILLAFIQFLGKVFHMDEKDMEPN